MLCEAYIWVRKVVGKQVGEKHLVVLASVTEYTVAIAGEKAILPGRGYSNGTFQCL